MKPPGAIATVLASSPLQAQNDDSDYGEKLQNHLSTLTRFLKWLDTSSRFDWTKPIAFGDMDTRIRRLAVDHARKSLEQVDTFSLDELKLLMRYGQPFDRLLLLLGLNCGFGRAEIASTTKNRIQFNRCFMR